jgi:hypothetical protein
VPTADITENNSDNKQRKKGPDGDTGQNSSSGYPAEHFTFNRDEQ